jgi:predicted transcriptional regulator
LRIKYRTREEIFAAILQSSLSDREGTKITKLMYDSFLNYRLLTDHLKELVELGFLVNEPEITRYKITEKGLRFLKLIEGMDGLLKN